MSKSPTKEGDRFHDAMKVILSVPKSEIERREMRYQKLRKRLKKLEKEVDRELDK